MRVHHSEGERHAQTRIAPLFDQAQNVLLLIAIQGLAETDVAQLGIGMHHDLVAREREDHVVAVDRFRNPGDRRDVANFD